MIGFAAMSGRTVFSEGINALPIVNVSHTISTANF
jgi:hypothetical protein